MQAEQSHRLPAVRPAPGKKTAPSPIRKEKSAARLCTKLSLALLCQSLGKGVPQKLPACFAFTAWILADEIIGARVAAVESYQVEASNGLCVAVTGGAKNARTSAGEIEGDEIVRGSALTAIKWNRSSLLRAFVEMSQGRLQRKAAIGIDPACPDLVRRLVEIPIERPQGLARHPRSRGYIPK